MNQLHTVMFWLTVLCVVIGAVLGVCGIWLPSSHKLGWRLFMTDMVLLATCLSLAVITKWLH